MTHRNEVDLPYSVQVLTQVVLIPELMTVSVHPCKKVIESPRIVANIEAVVPEPALKIKKVGFNSQIQTKFFDVMSSESGKVFNTLEAYHVPHTLVR